MEHVRGKDLHWYAERSFKPAYFAGDEVLEIANQAYQMYITDNALYSQSAFPSLQQYENDVVAMVLEMLHAPSGASGSLSTGGTESNLMAVKTARDWAREQLPNANRPNMVVPRTAHPSFDKATHMLGLDIRRAAKSPEFKADVVAMADLIDENTIMIVASAPPYPYGETDPIPALAELARQHGLWLHVDGCLGGFVLPFAQELDETIPPFDFRVPGVMSMSTDIHKYGYAAKGISSLLLCDAELEYFQRSSFDDWPSGLYATANVSGSRSGGALASAWAVMNHLGWQGYRDVVKDHIDIREQFIAGIESVDSLYVLGRPHTYNFAFASTDVDMFAVADGMLDRGWTLARANEPTSIQIMLNLAHAGIAATFTEELAEVVSRVRDGVLVARDGASIYAT